MNWEKTSDDAAKLHKKACAAKPVKLKLGGKEYLFQYSAYHCHYKVICDGEEILALNTRKASDAKKMFREWMAN
jgi:hypothetical protein